MYEKRSAANMLRAVGMHPKYKGDKEYRPAHRLQNRLHQIKI